MSYNIDFLRIPGIKDPLEEVEEVLEERGEQEERSEEPTPSEAEDQRRQKLVDDLLALSPALRMEPYDGGFSYGCVITTDDESCPIPEIYIDIDSAFTSFSYSADFELMFDGIGKLLPVFYRHGYVAYDPQSETILEPDDDLTASTNTATATREAVADMLEQRGEIVLGLDRPRKKPDNELRFTLWDWIAVLAVIYGIYMLVTL